MKITVLSVGNIKEKYLKDAILEYSKRISKYSKVEFIKINDEPITDNPSDKEIEIVKDKEAEKLLKEMSEEVKEDFMTYPIFRFYTKSKEDNENGKIENALNQ